MLQKSANEGNGNAQEVEAKITFLFSLRPLIGQDLRPSCDVIKSFFYILSLRIHVSKHYFRILINVFFFLKNSILFLHYSKDTSIVSQFIISGIKKL